MRKMILLSLTLLLLSACGNFSGSGGHVNVTFPKVNEPYHSEEAIKNGDVVNLHGQYFNTDKWEQFLRNVEAKKEDSVRITQYTVEGDPIFYELVYDGKFIHYTYDNSMDSHGSDLGRPSSVCKGIGTKKMEQGLEYYVLTECSNDTGNTFSFRKE